ncbi:MAG TPA: hypothetical protein VFB60_24110 [Ktedonobacteraceae bacterium]|nr:hypothetical protein [Ktedonobacteraceae bacterium]
MVRRSQIEQHFCNENPLTSGLTREMLSAGIEYVYSTLDTIDEKLLERDSPRLSGLVELANLSTIIGNLFNIGIIKASNGVFERAGPHKYQDLRTTGVNPTATNIEIKVALETNTPKGHLPKAGYYLTCRYVLGNADGRYIKGQRGEVVLIWELRFGGLELHHFNISNTEGDSGKTAVVNKSGMEQLEVIYFNDAYCPYGPKSQYLRKKKESPIKQIGFQF